MSYFTDAVSRRRSIYELNKNLPVPANDVMDFIKKMLLAVPDAFNMQSQRIIVITGNKNKEFWDAVYAKINDISNGNLSRVRTDSFAAGFGTILYFYDITPVNETRARYPMLSGNFHDWVMQSNGMLQFAIWTGLADMGVGANLQHYNPAIDNMVHDMFDIPESWILVAQMPFGGIVVTPDAKPKQDISERIKFES